MKKLLYLAVSFLSLAIVFAAGWASGVGTIKSKQEQPVVLKSMEPVDEVEEKCPECPENKENEDEHEKTERREHKHGFYFKLPFPPVDHDIIRNPKMPS